MDMVRWDISNPGPWEVNYSCIDDLDTGPEIVLIINTFWNYRY